MSSIPYSRYIFGTIPWYSFLIVTGVIVAVILACREEERAGLPKDTVIDLALWLIPFGIIGARVYYVVFSWEQFRYDLLSVFRIWEGGIAIYGGIIAGLIVLLLFCRNRHLSAFTLCDMIAPGLVFAQAIGRWGNWFNIEAYGFNVTGTAICFFPLAVQVPADQYAWHLATFFYESVWDFFVFLFLTVLWRKPNRKQGDLFFFYLFLYAAGRLIIEEMRLDSLYASSVRISQLLSVLLCISVFIVFYISARRRTSLSIPVRYILFPSALAFSIFLLFCMITGYCLYTLSTSRILLILLIYALYMTLCLFSVYHRLIHSEVRNADIQA
jgi:phosphatidylglycerol:prolipoprotein diacylglycerol transferase